MTRGLLVALLALPLVLAAQIPLSYQRPASPVAVTAVTQTVEVGGTLTRYSTSYDIEGGDVAGKTWVVGVKGETGYVEATQGGKRVACVKVGADGAAGLSYHAITLASDSPVVVSNILTHVTFPRPASLPQTAEAVGMVYSSDLIKDTVGFLTAQELRGVETVKVRVKTPTPKTYSLHSPPGFELASTQGSTLATFTSRIPVHEAAEEAQLAEVVYNQVEPVVALRSLDRLVEVSSWGNNLAFQDQIVLVNDGPKLEGHFARIDHQKAMMYRRPSAVVVNSLTLLLPPAAHSAYYVDIVGNVSTSRFSPGTSKASALIGGKKRLNPSRLDLSPRFPVMGGWNYSFSVGFDTPLSEFQHKSPEGGYMLAVPFLTAIRDVAIDVVRTSVRLPEGATNIKVTPPFDVDELTTDTVEKSYLDSVGRPTVKITRKGCADAHGGLIIITYDLPSIVDVLLKPGAVSTVLFAGFVLVAGLRRISWSIE